MLSVNELPKSLQESVKTANEVGGYYPVRIDDTSSKNGKEYTVYTRNVDVICIIQYTEYADTGKETIQTVYTDNGVMAQILGEVA